MLLTIDVGNTATVLGVFAGTQLCSRWRIATDPRRSADELALLVRGLLETASGSSGDPIRVSGIAVCATVPIVLTEVRAMCGRYFSAVPTVVVGPGVRTGVPILTDNPKEVGADRVVNALAAFHLHGGPTVVVDFGTATSFDVISAKGEFLGGAIAPGVEISVAALGERGAQLRQVELTRPRSVIGKNTVEALQSGILYGFAGQVDGVVRRMVAELGGTATVLATGGLAPLLMGECATIDVHEPELTLIGLRLVYARNTGTKPTARTP
jgi:type III pantothenate kinase